MICSILLSLLRFVTSQMIPHFFACDKDLNYLIKRLEHVALLAIERFQNSNMKLNQDKYYLLVSGCKHENVCPQIRDEMIWENNKQKLLGLQIDRNLKFN